MANVSEALEHLGITDWVLHGEPTTEDEFNSMFKKVTGEDSTGSAILSSDTDDFGVTWTQITAKKTEIDTDAPLKKLRVERNKRLVETDHYGLSDQTMTAAMTTYRQSLRDITDTYSDLDTVVWPTKP